MPPLANERLETSTVKRSIKRGLSLAFSRTTLLWFLTALAIVFGVVFLVSSRVARPADAYPSGVTTLDEAQICLVAGQSSNPPSVACDWKVARLPQQFVGRRGWSKLDKRLTDDAWVKVEFNLDRVPGEGVSLLTTSFSRTGRVFLNSELLASIGPMTDPLPLNWNRAQLFGLPPAMLRVGANELEIQVRHYIWEEGALSTLHLGPEATMRPIFKRRVLWQNDSIEIIGAITGAIGLVMLGVWILRRSEASYFWFGCTCLVWTVCNLDYYVSSPPIAPVRWESFVFQVTVLRAVLTCIFILRYCKRRMPKLEAGLWAYFLIGAVGSITGTLPTSLAVLWFLGPLLSTPFTAGLLIVEGMKRNVLDGGFVFVAAVAQSTLSWYDAWLYTTEQVGPIYLAEYSTLLYVLAVGLSLIRHFVASLTGYERQHAVALESLEQAKRATKERNLFFSMVSHELKSPLQSIITVLATEDSRARGRERRDSLKRIGLAVKNIEAQIRDLFVLSVGDDAKLEMRSETFEVGELIEGVAYGVSDLAAGKSLIVRVDRKADRLFVATDPKRVEQILLNLVENAIKYTPAGIIELSYGLDSETSLRISVADTGVGIPQEHLDKIFVPYRRFGLLDREHNSLGIGLAVVQTLVTHLGGTCDVNSTPGIGSTFSVTIPVAVEREEPDECDDDDAVRILIVDDRQEMLNDLSEVAETLGYQVETASSAPQASNQLAVSAFDVVLIDLDMPVKNGYELASEIRRSDGPNVQTPLVAISAGSLQVRAFESAHALWPFDSFEQKPIDARAMRRIVEARTRRADAVEPDPTQPR